MTNEERRIRGYLEAQAAKLSPPELIGKVEAAMADLRAALFSVPAERLCRDRAMLFERVRRADPDAHLDRIIDHGMFGPLNWRETVLFLRLHDLDHARQLQKIAAALA